MRVLLLNEDLLINTNEYEAKRVDVAYNKIGYMQIFYVSSNKETPEHFIADMMTDITSIKYKENLFYNKNNGVYFYIYGDVNNKSLVVYRCLKERGRCQYKTFNLEYSCNNLLTRFNLYTEKDREINDKLQSLLKYSFGFEFETSSGMIPEHLCYKYGLIPLRDGSISGFEYSSIVLGKTYGLSILKNQLKLLKKYTSFDKECSLHIHFGKVPNDIRFIFTLYKVCKKFEDAIVSVIPKYAFNTSKFKKSKKDYCKKLLDFSNISEMYNYYISNEDFYINENDISKIDLTANHPNDSSRTRKWNVSSRYHWVNFINLLFYKKHKTVEFRFLSPTRNFNKITIWLYILTGMIKIAESIYCRLKDLPIENFYTELNTALYSDMGDSLYDVIDVAYCYEAPHVKRCSMFRALRDLETLKQKQELLHDYIGAESGLDDLICISKFIK